MDCGRSDRFLDTEVLGFRDPAAAVQFLDGAVEENLEGGTEDEVLQKIRNELLGLCGWIVPFGTSAACGATLYGSRGWRRVRKIEYGRLLKREATRKRVVNFINYFIKCPLATKILGPQRNLWVTIAHRANRDPTYGADGVDAERKGDDQERTVGTSS